MQIRDNIDSKVNIVYCTDENFITICRTAIYSLLENKKHREVAIHVILNEVSETGKASIERTVKNYDDVEVFFYEISDISERIKTTLSFDNDRYSVSTFIRLLIGSILPRNIKKIIYLDCDTIVCSDLSELYNYDIGDCVIGGVDDCKSVRYRYSVGIPANSEYINCGVLLIDLKKWREIRIEDKFLEYIKKQRGKIQDVDQGVINVCLQGKIKRIPIEFNVMSHMFDLSYKEMLFFRRPVNPIKQDEMKYSIENPKIIHFTSSFLTIGRVWNSNSNHKEKELYDDYMKRANPNYRQNEYHPASIRCRFRLEYIIRAPRPIVLLTALVAHELFVPLKFYIPMKMRQNKERRSSSLN